MPEENRTRPFADFLAEHNRGQAAREASEALQRLVLAAQETGKKGSVTIKVDVAPMDGTDTAMITVVTVKETLPTVSPRPTVFYADADGNLTRDDPMALPFESLKEVEAPAPLKDVATTTAADGAGS